MDAVGSALGDGSAGVAADPDGVALVAGAAVFEHPATNNTIMTARRFISQLLSSRTDVTTNTFRQSRIVSAGRRKSGVSSTFGTRWHVFAAG
jgi:hypothetical protein